jgi:hypothetical protein
MSRGSKSERGRCWRRIPAAIVAGRAIRNPSPANGTANPGQRGTAERFVGAMVRAIFSAEVALRLRVLPRSEPSARVAPMRDDARIAAALPTPGRCANGTTSTSAGVGAGRLSLKSESRIPGSRYGFLGCGTATWTVPERKQRGVPPGDHAMPENPLAPSSSQGRERSLSICSAVCCSRS